MISNYKWLIYLDERFNKLTHTNRIFILLLGWVCTYLIWYFFFSSPMLIARNELKNKISTTTQQINFNNVEMGRLRSDAQKIKKEAESSKKLAEKDLPVQAIGQNKTSEYLIKQFFNLQKGIKNISIKSNVLSSKSYALQVQFTSGYFETLAYLVRLEQLPWCLSWDTLSYTVNNYPDAAIDVTLHTENA